jgi:uncharacterized protein (DUF1697 family)
MTRYVALLRAIGPATHARMPLGELAALCVEAGLEEVVNLGNTGNLLFTSGQSQAAVEASVTQAVKSFGLGNEVFTRTQRQIQMLVGLSPFAEAAADHPERLGVCFFHKDPRWPTEYQRYAGPEQLRMFSNHLIVDYRAGISVSRLSIEKTVGARMTQRNWSTVLRIAGKLGAAGQRPDEA